MGFTRRFFYARSQANTYKQENLLVVKAGFSLWY